MIVDVSFPDNTQYIEDKVITNNIIATEL